MHVHANRQEVEVRSVPAPVGDKYRAAGRRKMVDHPILTPSTLPPPPVMDIKADDCADWANSRQQMRRQPTPSQCAGRSASASHSAWPKLDASRSCWKFAVHRHRDPAPTVRSPPHPVRRMAVAPDRRRLTPPLPSLVGPPLLRAAHRLAHHTCARARRARGALKLIPSVLKTSECCDELPLRSRNTAQTRMRQLAL